MAKRRCKCGRTKQGRCYKIRPDGKCYFVKHRRKG